MNLGVCRSILAAAIAITVLGCQPRPAERPNFSVVTIGDFADIRVNGQPPARTEAMPGRGQRWIWNASLGTQEITYQEKGRSMRMTVSVRELGGEVLLRTGAKAPHLDRALRLERPPVADP